MNSCYYHSFADSLAKSHINACNRASDDAPFMVNCAGVIATEFPFTTDNVDGRQDFYLLYVNQGEMDVSFLGGLRHVGAGSVLLFPPNSRYTYHYLGGEPLNYSWVHFTGSYAKQFLKDCGFSPLPFLHAIDSENSVPAKFKKIFELYEAQGPLAEQRLACALEQLLLTLALTLRKKEAGLERSLRVIHSAYHTPLRIPDLAKMENLSHSRYITVFRERTGLSPTAYLIELRMRVACELLQTTDLSVQQISLSVGYEDAHFFSKLFKKHVGVSPKKYQQEK